ncbi:YjbF family lipoprotein [Pseudorhodobacter sp. E13]|uniref:YjbF family lipoprotein n=1 Tax=Pseudorhodobacter sp. E13 TaxID=2487931 RepID=UPI000F8D7215|nr:YjbF family lipoprotein [Pseudorhodobacter sp. E13]RUS58930.1 YjbF family lipoprotein [Pseudorhodobacter sp. E13]
MTVFSPLRMLALAIMAMTLASCGSDKSSTDVTGSVKVIATAMTGFMRKDQPTQVQDLGLTRAALATLPVPAKRITLEKYGQQALVVQIGTNKDVETWSSVDKITLSMRNGVVVATRGLIDDLMTASVPSLSMLSHGSSHTRTHSLLNGEDKPRVLRFDCQVARHGRVNLTIVERSYTTQHVTETCTGAEGSFTNEYWLEAGGKLRRSRQTISDFVGPMTIDSLD